MQTLSVTLPPGGQVNLPPVPLPAVAHVKTEDGLGHFVVLHCVLKNGGVVAEGVGIRIL